MFALTGLSCPGSGHTTCLPVSSRSQFVIPQANRSFLLSLEADPGNGKATFILFRRMHRGEC